MRQAGLSLVEMLIALTLGAIVSVGVIQLFSANSDTYNLMQGQSRMQESARFALNFIGRAVQQAGYKGCFSTNTGVETTLYVPDDLPYEYDLRKGMQGYDGQLGGTWLPALTDLQTAYVSGNEIDTTTILGQTDVLTTRSMSQTTVGLIADMGTAKDDPVVEKPASGLEFAVNDLIMIEDCEKASIFKVTKILPGSSQYTIEHSTAGVDPTDNYSDRLSSLNTFYKDDTGLGAIETSTFYIAPGAGYNNAGEHPLSLWRKYGTDAPVELVEGVEDLQVLYGVDSDGDGVPNTYTTANLVTDYTTVVTVRVTVTVNSIDDVGATKKPTWGCIGVDPNGEQNCIDGQDYDGLVRRTFSQTFQLRNLG